MASARSNGRRPCAIADAVGNGDKLSTVSVQQVRGAPGDDREELKAGQRNGDGLRWELDTLLPGEDTEPVRDHQGLILRQHQAIGLLVQGMTVTDVARELGVNRCTIHGWLNDPDFRLKLEARREELLTSMLDEQLLASRMATTKLIELLESEDERVALRAAIILYSGGQRIYYFVDLKKHIELLENNMQIYYGRKV